MASITKEESFETCRLVVKEVHISTSKRSINNLFNVSELITRVNQSVKQLFSPTIGHRLFDHLYHAGLSLTQFGCTRFVTIIPSHC